MKIWKKLNINERRKIEQSFNKSKLFEIKVYSEEPRLILEDGTMIYIEGIQE